MSLQKLKEKWRKIAKSKGRTEGGVGNIMFLKLYILNIWNLFLLHKFKSDREEVKLWLKKPPKRDIAGHFKGEKIKINPTELTHILDMKYMI